jgi:hypothetical protein
MKVMPRLALLLVALVVLFCAFAPPAAHAQEPAAPPAAVGAESQTGGAPSILLAERKGPIIWHLDPEKQQAMENDLELYRLYNEAMAGRERRRTIGYATGIPGVVLIGLGFFGGLFQHAMNLYDENAGDVIMVSGVTGGGVLLGVGIYFLGFQSDEEKAYEKYLKEKYGVTPIMQLTPAPNGWMASVGVRF